MSQKITKDLFLCARQLKADNLVLSSEKEQLKISYYLPGEDQKDYFLPLKYLEGVKKEIIKLIEKVSDDFLEQSKLSKKPGNYKDKRINISFFLSLISLGAEEKIIIDFKKSKKEDRWRLSELGLKKEQQKTLENIIEKGRGLIILAGEKDSGKSATLSAIINKALSEKKSLCLLSDNWETKNLIVMELNDSSLDLAKKGDFDIVAIDGIKNKDYFSQAFRLASYGKLVIATIEVDSPKELARKIKLTAWPIIEKKNLIKAISFQELIRLKPLVNKKDKRQKIARFKLLNSE